MGKRGDSFARWFVALPNGRKFILSLVMASTTILTPTLLLTPTHVGSGRITSNQFEFTCMDNRNGDHQVSVELPTDPDRINEMNAHPEQFAALFRTVCPSY
jgi:hypothetical protein